MKNKKLFGTDGIRGLVNHPPIDPMNMVKIGHAIGRNSKTVIISRDTRNSGEMLERALSAGLIAMGTTVILLGVLPTAAVAMLTKKWQADYGIMISASHNPNHDNGIKIFKSTGFKLTINEEEEFIELFNSDIILPDMQPFGKVTKYHNADQEYSNFIINSLKKDLSGCKIVIDCANGAAYKIAPHIFQQLQAEVITLNDKPNGTNINQQCGVLSAQVISEAVIQHQADLGIAFDGDADRLILCDERGKIIDGEQILSTFALKIKSDTLVTTIMSSLSFEKYLQKHDIQLIRSDVGDRHIMECMLKNKCPIGGEASGHIILSEYSTTSDGIMAAVQIAASLPDQKMSELCHHFVPQPLISRNIRYHHEIDLESEKIKTFMSNAQKELGEEGKILIRQSGTEPVIRILAEGPDFDHINHLVEEAINIINQTN